MLVTVRPRGHRRPLQHDVTDNRSRAAHGFVGGQIDLLLPDGRMSRIRRGPRFGLARSGIVSGVGPMKTVPR